MVRNSGGGNGCKSSARKHATKAIDTRTRLPESEYELFAQVTNLLGNNMVHVIDEKDKRRLCMIRGKFRTRGRRDNTLVKGSWVLIGVREYETVKEESKVAVSASGKVKLDNCDLLEVYNDRDKHMLLREVPDHPCWAAFQRYDDSLTSTKESAGGSLDVRFVDEGPLFTEDGEESVVPKRGGGGGGGGAVLRPVSEVDIDDI